MYNFSVHSEIALVIAAILLSRAAKPVLMICDGKQMCQPHLLYIIFSAQMETAVCIRSQ